MADRPSGIGNRIAPPRFLAFAGASAVGCAAAIPLLGWRAGVMIGFDLGALLFFALGASLLSHEAKRMRESARRNDANRFGLLLLTGAVMLAVLAAVASELLDKDKASAAMLALIVATLACAWIFSNAIYALHYAHLFYTADEKGRDSGGLAFPETKEPDYWDFIYFAFCLGMTFQTSDVETTRGQIRRVVTLHCLEAFVFNLGVIAFTINVLGGG